jgi:hypothetical protein
MVIYNWKFPAFECRVNENGLQKVVTVVHWRYGGTDQDGITAEIYGAQGVGEPNPDAFTPYPQISEEQVAGWMEASMDIEAMRENIANQINLIKNPVTEILPAPWQTTPLVEQIVEQEQTVLDTEE